MAMGDLTIVRRSMTARLFSTVTTIVTVAVAVGLMLVLLSMRDSGQRAFSRGSGNMHLLVSRDASPIEAVLNGVFYANAPRNYIEWREYEALLNQPGPGQPPLIVQLEWAIPTQLGDSYRGHPVMAADAALMRDFKPVEDEAWSLAAGRMYQAPFEVVLGSGAAAGTSLAVGDEIYLTHGRSEEGSHQHREYAYEVVGILAPTGSAHDRAVFTDLESSWIVHAHDRRKQELGSDIELTTPADVVDADRKITGVYMRVAGRGDGPPAALPQVFDRLRRNPTLTAVSPSDQIRELFKIVGNIDQILVGMAAVVMVSSGIAIMLALYNSMEQRRRQIAVMRVLGCSRGRVFGLVLTESAMLGLLGALAGVLLAYIGAQVVASVLEARLGLVVEPVVALELVLMVIVATVALSSLAGLAPALMGYRTSVVRNLRPIG